VVAVLDGARSPACVSYGRQRAAAGLTWRGYMESMPSAAFAGDTYPYMPKHNPFA
jgi:hypothetical protein